MTRRKLTKEEIALWQKVNERTDRMAGHKDKFDQSAPNSQLPKPKPKKPVNGHSVDPFMLGSAAKPQAAPHNLKKPLSTRLETQSLGMDRKAYGKMRRGKLKPEGRIDLHGMTLAQAHPMLTQFILSAQSQRKRLVLVITGKGKIGDDAGPIPRPRGVLKHQVPDWLSRPPLAQAVLQISEAHISHGGAGAYYVYLRRAR